MTVLGSGDITLPTNIAAGLWSKAQGGSTVAALSGSEPMQFGEVTLMTFPTPPRAEYVAQGADKAASTVGFSTKTVTPHKVQVTLRFNEEVKWADEDYQLGILTACANASGDALGRALDLGVYHAVNPISGANVSAITEQLTDTSNVVTVGANADIDVESAAGLVIGGEFVPNGIALDPLYAWTLATARYTDGRKKFPDLGFGTSITNFQGLSASVSSTVSGQPEASDTGVRAIIGDFKTIRWGVQRRVPVQMIEFGDPDGQGDLKRKNQIALRTEVVYGWAFLDLDAFAVISGDAESS